MKIKLLFILFTTSLFLQSCEKKGDSGESDVKANTYYVAGVEYPIFTSLYLEQDAGDIFANDTLTLEYRLGTITLGSLEGGALQLAFVNPGVDIIPGTYNFVSVDSSDESKTSNLAVTSISNGIADGNDEEDFDLIFQATGSLEIRSISETSIDIEFDFTSSENKRFNGAYSGVIYSGS